MTFKSVSIIGLGLIGGSLATALKTFKVAEEVVGFDIDSEVVNYAIRNNVVDKGVVVSDELEIDSEIVVVATYVDQLVDTIRAIIPSLKKGTVITDVGSVKARVVNQFDIIFDGEIYFVGSHPIAGTENSGLKFSDPNLFKDKKTVVTPSPNTDLSALEKVIGFWESVGSSVIQLDPDTHDLIFAYVSHLPHVVAYSLMNSLSSVDGIENIVSYSGGGLRDYTRIAASSPEMWVPILSQNKESVLKAIKGLKVNLSEIEDAIESDDQQRLVGLLKAAQELKKSSLS